MPYEKRSNARHFTEAARAAAVAARRVKAAEFQSFGAPELFVVRASSGDMAFTWELRRFGGVVIQRVQTAIRPWLWPKPLGSMPWQPCLKIPTCRPSHVRSGQGRLYQHPAPDALTPVLMPAGVEGAVRHEPGEGGPLNEPGRRRGALLPRFARPPHLRDLGGFEHLVGLRQRRILSLTPQPICL